MANFESIHPEKTIRDFLSYAQTVEEIGEPRGFEPLMDSSAIKVLTIHAAKGLEFDAIFLPGLAQWKFPAVSRREPFEIPSELIPEALPEGDHHLQEARRLMYVAVTRARESLFLSVSDFYDGKKQWKMSCFLNEMLESGKVALAGVKERSGRESPSPAQLAILPQEKAREQRSIKLDLQKLSYTQMEVFRTCPLKYQFRYLSRIPAPIPSIVHFGSSIHNTLRDFYDEVMKHPSKDIAEAKSLLLVPAGYDSWEHQQDQKRRGRAMLERFYEKEKTASGRPEYLEQAFTLAIDGVTLTGRIDRIDRLPDGTFEVIDYKTGAAKERDLKHDLQLSIYALACRDVLKIRVLRFSLYFLDGLEKISTTRSEEEMEICRREIAACARDLMDSDFSSTPGFHCRFCDYRLICPAMEAVVA
ncbi:PD-(D/E)XK nuclease family protein [Candidatus Peregrinibacteria bacterium]|nr:PD-(D/E)XK nuclease family protein [Candidatus Peregrinibacteria bacterium]